MSWLLALSTQGSSPAEGQDSDQRRLRHLSLVYMRRTCVVLCATRLFSIVQGQWMVLAFFPPAVQFSRFDDGVFERLAYAYNLMLVYDAYCTQQYIQHPVIGIESGRI